MLSGSPKTSIAAGSTYTFQPVASDAEGDPLRFSIANRPAWATFDYSSGRLSGTPTAASVGTYSNIAIMVTDGSALTNLAGYRIVYGAAATQLTQTIQLANPRLSAYVVENLAPGTYYFAVRAYTSKGAQSTESNVVAKIVR